MNLYHFVNISGISDEHAIGKAEIFYFIFHFWQAALSPFHAQGVYCGWVGEILLFFLWK